MKWIKLVGYKIKVNSITGLTDVEKREEEVKNPITKKTETSIVYHVSIFFDGMKIEWYFDNEESANNLYNLIDHSLNEE